MLKKMNEKKNNKGFSLVELIVVILIMAVLAVALAPQVMKWVGNARIANDKQTVESIMSGVQLALAQEGGTSYDIKIVYTGSTSTWAVSKADGTGNGTGSKPTEAHLEDVIGSSWDAALKSSGITSVTITGNGANLSVAYDPTTLFDDLD